MQNFKSISVTFVSQKLSMLSLQSKQSAGAERQLYTFNRALKNEGTSAPSCFTHLTYMPEPSRHIVCNPDLEGNCQMVHFALVL